MTGFGKSSTENETAKIDIELKSLNSKSLDLKIKSSLPIGAAEIEIQNTISQSLQRGKVDCYITLTPKEAPVAANINNQIFDFYYNRLKNISTNYNHNFDNENIFETILRLPKVVEFQEIEIDAFLSAIMQTLKESLEKLEKFRVQEGKALEKDLLNNLSVIEQSLDEVPKFEQERIETMRQRIVSSFEELKLNVDQQRLEAEMIFYLEKYDINEEKIRLRNHIEYFRKSMNEQNCGRKLGFISQEMGREINTLGSKANNFEIQRLVVVMKDYLEKIKEQILNVL